MSKRGHELAHILSKHFRFFPRGKVATLRLFRPANHVVRALHPGTWRHRLLFCQMQNTAGHRDSFTSREHKGGALRLSRYMRQDEAIVSVNQYRLTCVSNCRG